MDRNQSQLFIQTTTSDQLMASAQWSKQTGGLNLLITPAVFLGIDIYLLTTSTYTVEKCPVKKKRFCHNHHPTLAR